MICLYLKIPENFERLILQYEFWVGHISLVQKVNFHFLVRLPAENLPHPVEAIIIIIIIIIIIAAAFFVVVVVVFKK